ncbi:hypothetical protein JCM10556A_01130 [Bacteroides acidifaciens]
MANECDKEDNSEICRPCVLYVFGGSSSILDATVLLYFIQDTFGLYGTGIEGWRPDIS